jgi:hypothetical protein
MCLRILLGNHQRVCITKLLKLLYPISYVKPYGGVQVGMSNNIQYTYSQREGRGGRVELERRGEGQQRGIQIINPILDEQGCILPCLV